MIIYIYIYIYVKIYSFIVLFLVGFNKFYMLIVSMLFLSWFGKNS
jgi:hypothetical protein